jgi:hypothetical protein
MAGTAYACTLGRLGGDAFVLRRAAVCDHITITR